MNVVPFLGGHLRFGGDTVACDVPSVPSDGAPARNRPHEFIAVEASDVKTVAESWLLAIEPHRYTETLRHKVRHLVAALTMRLDSIWRVWDNPGTRTFHRRRLCSRKGGGLSRTQP